MVNPSDNPDLDKQNMLYPRMAYHGKFEPPNLVFNANLQEFAQRINYICNLETAGKITTESAYDQIKDLWHQLKKSRKDLGIGEEK